MLLSKGQKTLLDFSTIRMVSHIMNSHIKVLSQLHERIAVQHQPGREFQSIILREQAEAYCQRHSIDIYEFMQLLVPLAQKYALTPISGFPVGAVILGQSGNCIWVRIVNFEG